MFILEEDVCNCGSLNSFKTSAANSMSRTNWQAKYSATKRTGQEQLIGPNLGELVQTTP